MVWAVHKQPRYVYGTYLYARRMKAKSSPCVQGKLCCCQTVSDTLKHAQSERTMCSFTAVPPATYGTAVTLDESLPSRQSKQRNWDLLAKGRNVRASRPRELFLLHFSCQVDSEPRKCLFTIYDSCLEFQDMLYYDLVCFNVKSPNTHLVVRKSLLNDYNHPTTL